MMKRSQKVILFALVAAGCFNAKAYALEHEFHGAYNLTYYLSNYENASAPGMILTGPNATLNGGAAGLPIGNHSNNLKTNNYFEQRARIYYNAKADADTKLVTAFEIDTIWGDKSGNSAARGSGGALEADGVNLETKWVYLETKVPIAPTTVRFGIQPFKDNIKGLFADFDIAGINTTTELGNAKINIAYFRAYDQSFFGTQTTRGQNDLDIGVVGVKYSLGKSTNVGLDYYLYNDPRGINVAAAAKDMMIHTFGLYGDTKLGKVNVSGLLAYQGGIFENATASKSYLNAVAYNLAANAPIGPGTFKSALLFTSGNSNEASTGNSSHYTGWVGTNQSQNATWNTATGGTNSYNDSDMMLLTRSTMNMPSSTDNHIVFNSGNGTTPINSQGQYLISAGYEVPVTDAFNIKSNLGLAWVARTNALKPIDKLTGKQNESNFQGTEINLEAKYKMTKNVTTKFQAAYVMLGDYYKNAWSSAVTGNGVKTPEDPYTVRFVVNYAF